MRNIDNNLISQYCNNKLASTYLVPWGDTCKVVRTIAEREILWTHLIRTEL